MLLVKAEKDFKAQHGFYTTDFNALILAPKVVLYKIGFATASEPNTSLDSPTFRLRPELKDLDSLKAAFPKIEVEFSPVTKLDAIHFAEAAQLCPDCTATRDHFKAIAVANLDDDATLDAWTVDETGTFLHIVDDLKQ